MANSNEYMRQEKQRAQVGERHHHDYSKPKEILWLCREHHLKLHYGGESNVGRT